MSAFSTVRIERLASITGSVLVMLLAFTAKAVYAEDWYSINEDPQGTVAQPPLALEKYPLPENAEKHYPPNRVFTLQGRNASVPLTIGRLDTPPTS